MIYNVKSSLNNKYIESIKHLLTDEDIIKMLLIDRTTDKNIIWATKDYECFGEEYKSHLEIKFYLIQGKNSVIKERLQKNKIDQDIRRKERAEVFTPSWLCNEQNNLIDNEWFGENNVFNYTKNKDWKSTQNKIIFPEHKSWINYVDERRMEMGCGEAPYLVSRYDTVSGKLIEVNDRIGILDRKMRIVSENNHSEKEWIYWSKRAFQSVYGFEFQGDSLFLARRNLLMTYIDYMRYKLKRNPTKKELIEIAEVVSWNLWQMDGLTNAIPYQEKIGPFAQMSIFEILNEEKYEPLSSQCKVKDWRREKVFTFSELLSNGEENE